MDKKRSPSPRRPNERRRSRSREREKDAKKGERRRSRSPRRSRSRSPPRRFRRSPSPTRRYGRRTPSPRRRRSSHSPPRRSRRSRSRSRSQERKGGADRVYDDRDAVDMDVEGDVSNEINNINEEEEMAKLMGFSAFNTTKGKHVPGAANLEGAKLVKAHKYRQYMNRRGGFNRPLDYVA